MGSCFHESVLGGIHAEILRNTLIYFLSKRYYHSIKELLGLTSEILRPLEKGDRIE